MSVKMLFYQVNNILKQNSVIKRFWRRTHSDQNQLKMMLPLHSRSLVKISGDDASPFLQGLVTNDMKHFENGAKSMYALFLNNKGRILYDTLIHKWGSDNNCFLIECDRKVLPNLEKHLKVYKLKRQVNVVNVSKSFKLWALIAPETPVTDLKVDPNSDINIFKDPRHVELGSRVLTSSMIDKVQLLKTICGDNVVSPDNEDGYRFLRYRLGVGEGYDDLPPGTIFPLEANCEYLHGVSFHKGCYLGQELLARVHFTGVVRKRIMPIQISSKETDGLVSNCAIFNDDTNKEVGKLQGVIQDSGIALLRVKEALEAKQLKLGNLTATVNKPDWWPIEAPKEQLNKAQVTEKEKNVGQ